MQLSHSSIRLVACKADLLSEETHLPVTPPKSDTDDATGSVVLDGSPVAAGNQVVRRVTVQLGFKNDLGIA